MRFVQILGFCGAIVILFCFYYFYEAAEKENYSTNKGTVKIGGSFKLINQNREIVTEKSFPNKYLLVFFGFTNCPDICPLSMDKIIEAMDLLGKKSKKLQPLFITVDPERDTPDILATYVSSFDTRIICLTGTKEQIRKVSNSYKVYYQKQSADEKDNQTSDYQVNHSAITYLMSDKGQFIIHFSYGTTAKELAAKLDKIL